MGRLLTGVQTTQILDEQTGVLQNTVEASTCQIVQVVQESRKQTVEEIQRGLRVILQGNEASENDMTATASRTELKRRQALSSFTGDFVIEKEHSVPLATTVDQLRLDLKGVLGTLCTTPEISFEQADMDIFYTTFKRLYKETLAAASKVSDDCFFLPDQETRGSRSLIFPGRWILENGWKAGPRETWTLSCSSNKSRQWWQLSKLATGCVLVGCRRVYATSSQPGMVQMHLMFTPNFDRNMVSFAMVCQRQSEVQIEPSIERKLQVFKTFSNDEQWSARDAVVAGDLQMLIRAVTSRQGSVWDRDEEGNSLLYVSMPNTESKFWPSC